MLATLVSSFFRRAPEARPPAVLGEKRGVPCLTRPPTQRALVLLLHFDAVLMTVGVAFRVRPAWGLWSFCELWVDTFNQTRKTWLLFLQMFPLPHTSRAADAGVTASCRPWATEHHAFQPLLAPLFASLPLSRLQVHLSFLLLCPGCCSARLAKFLCPASCLPTWSPVYVFSVKFLATFRIVLKPVSSNPVFPVISGSVSAD